MAIDMKRYIGAFLEEFQGSYAGEWGQSVSNFYPDLQSLTTGLPGINGTPGMKAYSGTRQKKSPNDFSVDLVATEYESSFEIALENFRLDNVGIYENSIRDLARKAKFHWNKVVTDAIAANANCSDGGALFNASHTIRNAADSGTTTQSNLLTNTDYGSLDVVTVAAPTDVEMANIIVDLVSHAYSLKDYYSDLCNGDARLFYLLTGDVKKHAAAMKAVSEGRLSSGNDNPTTGLQNGGITVKPIFDAAVTGASIYLIRGDGNVKSFILGETTEGIVALGPETEYAKANRKVLFAYDAVRGIVPGRYQSIIKATLS